MADSTTVIDIILRAKNEAEGELKRLGASLSGTGDDLKRFKQDLIIAGAGITAAGFAINALVTDAGKFASVKQAFSGMTAGMIESTDGFIEAVQTASMGTLSQMSILSGATKALSLIGKDSFGNFQEDFGQMAGLVQKAAIATGQDADFMFQSLITGVSRSSKMILDNLGITVDMAAAQSKYADELMRTKGLTEEEAAKASLLRSVIEQLGTTYGGVSVGADSFAVQQAQLKTQFEDLKIAIGEAFIPVISRLLTEVIIPFVDQYGPMFAATLAGWLDSFSKLPEPIQNAVIGVLAAIPALLAVGGAIKVLSSIWGVLQFIIMNVVVPAVTFIIGLFGGPLIAAIGLVVAAVIIWWKNWDFLLATMKDLANNFVINVKGFWEDLKASISKSLDGITSSVQNAISNWIPRFDSAQQVIWKVAGAIQGVLDKARELAREGLDKLGLPHFASGGIVPGPVGSPQLAVVHGGEEVIPTNRTSAVGGGGGTGITFNVSVGLYAGSEIEKRNIATQLYDSLVRVAQAHNLSVAEYMGG